MAVLHGVDRCVPRIEHIGLVEIVIGVEPGPEIIVEPGEVEGPLPGTDHGIVPIGRGFLFGGHRQHALRDGDVEALILPAQRQLV